MFKNRLAKFLKFAGFGSDKFLLDLIFPRHCISCGKLNPDGGYDYLCSDCANGVFSHQLPRCKKCSEIVGGEVALFRCAKCEGCNFYFDESRVACEYADAGRDLVLELKYRGGVWVAGDIAKLCSKIADFEDYFGGATLVPVPIHPSRKAKRGYNQSAKIAEALRANFPNLNLRVSDILKRVKATPTQTLLSREDRALNVKNAFKLRENSISKDSKIIVLDDVMTSGATLNECAAVLKRSGFECVRAFAFARRS